MERRNDATLGPVLINKDVLLHNVSVPGLRAW